MPWTVLQILLLILFPFLSRRMERLGWLPSWLSPVVLCYAIGIVIRNFHLFPINDEIATAFSEYSIVMAIPLLLYGTRLGQWMKHAKGTLGSFLLCVLSGLICTTLAAVIYQDKLDDAWRLSGMLVGIYTGGTPNMQAVGLALGASQETIILVNAADVFWGGVYLLFLTSLAPKAYGLFLPHDKKTIANAVEAKDTMDTPSPYPVNYRDVLKSIGITVVVLALSAGACLLLFGDLKNIAFLMLMLTTLSIVASFIPVVQRLDNTFETGEYFLLIFCIALGMLADFSQMSGSGLDILFFTAIALFSTILLHLLLAYLFKIDRDLLLFTSVAALYGPAFIGQIASITGNRQLIFSGIAMGLLGYAMGNYLGIGLAYVLKALL